MYGADGEDRSLASCYALFLTRVIKHDSDAPCRVWDIIISNSIHTWTWSRRWCAVQISGSPLTSFFIVLHFLYCNLPRCGFITCWRLILILLGCGEIALLLQHVGFFWFNQTAQARALHLLGADSRRHKGRHCLLLKITRNRSRFIHRTRLGNGWFFFGVAFVVGLFASSGSGASCLLCVPLRAALGVPFVKDLLGDWRWCIPGHGDALHIVGYVFVAAVCIVGSAPALPQHAAAF